MESVVDEAIFENEIPIGTLFWADHAPIREVHWHLKWPFGGNLNRMMLHVDGWRPLFVTPPYVQQQLSTWLDASDCQWPVIPRLSAFSFNANSSHAALRRLVFSRAGWRCRECGAGIPEEDFQIARVRYDGRSSVILESGDYLVIDHKLSRRNGGTNHPENLQALCGSCNSRKAGTVDRVFHEIVRSLGFSQ